MEANFVKPLGKDAVGRAEINSLFQRVAKKMREEIREESGSKK